MSYEYWLPNTNGKKEKHTAEQNAVIIVGANGSGKSKLGAWIEEQQPDSVHRIAAQRKLNFSAHLPLKSYKDAENYVFYGDQEADAANKIYHRWGNHLTTRLIDDFDDVLAALLALKNNENDVFIKQFENFKAANNLTALEKPETVVDKLIKIWHSVLPQRDIVIEDSRFFASIKKGMWYSATQMSDGERAVLYLAAQVLCVPQGKVLIIDEPELHLHRSIMNKLWKMLERNREDCLFIYITHDLQFAASHGDVDKIWIKEFDGLNWKMELIQDENIPEELLFEVLGSRRDVLFVEGEKNSYDTQLYALLYPNYLIIPCGSCIQVIQRTKAFRQIKFLHEYEVYGLIDRDYRSEYEIEAYKGDNIYVLDVAEVENLFLVEELIRFMAVQFGGNEDEAFAKVKDFIINTKFANMINGQICQSVVSEIKYQLSRISIVNNHEESAKKSLNEGLKAIDYDAVKREKECAFNKALADKDYKSVLRLFNEKGLAASVGCFLGVVNKDYQRKVINLLQGSCRNDIIKALVPYLPPEVPM